MSLRNERTRSNTRHKIILIAISCLIGFQLTGCSLFDDDDEIAGPGRSELIGDWAEVEFLIDGSPSESENWIAVLQLDEDGTGGMTLGTPEGNSDPSRFGWGYNPPNLSMIFGSPEMIIEWNTIVSFEGENLHLNYEAGDEHRELIFEPVE